MKRVSPILLALSVAALTCNATSLFPPIEETEACARADLVGEAKVLAIVPLIDNGVTQKWASIISIEILTLCLLALTDSPAEEDALQNPALKKFYSAMRSLVKRYYPEASSHLLKDTIHFEHNTRIFIVHEPHKTGEWQDPWEERGPKPGGILCDLELRKGKYAGAAVVPQTFDKRYFTVWLLAPYSGKFDCHLYVHLYCPRDVSTDFLKQFRELVNEFEKYRE